MGEHLLDSSPPPGLDDQANGSESSSASDVQLVETSGAAAWEGKGGARSAPNGFY